MNGQDSPRRLFSSVPLERRIEELTILYEVSRALQKTVDEEKTLCTILVGIISSRGLGFDRAFILLLDSEGKFLDGRLAIGASSPEEAEQIWQRWRGRFQTLADIFGSLDGLSIRRDRKVNDIVMRFHVPVSDGENPLIRIMRSREACRAVEGVFQPHGYPVGDQLAGLLGSSAFAVAPLFLADRELGLVIADNAVTGAPIDQTNLGLLQIYAQAASSAVQNTRLYRELTQKILLFEQMNQALRDNQYHLLQAERLTTIGKMAALLAHEIRTPLVSIGGFARRLLRTSPPDDPRLEEMEIIVSEVRRLEKLVDEVLGYSRISRPEYRPTDVNAIIRGVVVTLQDELHKNSIRVQMDLDACLPPAETDEDQLRQALMNLITNAIDAMPEGGTLTLTTGFDDGYLEIGVADTGMGMNRESLDKLFTPFYTTKTTGTGLGLAVVSQVIDNHNGSLRFESAPGQGTSFHVRLAFHPDRTSSRAAPSGKYPIAQEARQ